MAISFSKSAKRFRYRSPARPSRRFDERANEYGDTACLSCRRRAGILLEYIGAGEPSRERIRQPIHRDTGPLRQNQSLGYGRHSAKTNDLIAGFRDLAAAHGPHLRDLGGKALNHGSGQFELFAFASHHGRQGARPCTDGSARHRTVEPTRSNRVP